MIPINYTIATIPTDEMVIWRKRKESFLSEQVSRVAGLYSDVPKAFSWDVKSSPLHIFMFILDGGDICSNKKLTCTLYPPISPSSAPPSDLMAHSDSFLRATSTNLARRILVETIRPEKVFCHIQAFSILTNMEEDVKWKSRVNLRRASFDNT